MNLEIKIAPAKSQGFDNKERASLLITEMNRGSQFTVQFGTDKGGYPYAWVSSNRLTPFKLFATNELVSGLITYLTNGTPMDEMVNADSYEVYGESKNFQLDVLKQASALKHTPKLNPKSLDESNPYINAISKYKNGTVLYALKKEDPQVMAYFQQQNLL